MSTLDLSKHLTEEIDGYDLAQYLKTLLAQGLVQKAGFAQGDFQLWIRASDSKGVPMITVGDRIKELSADYIQIYEDLKTNSTLSDKAAALALTDPILKKFTWEQVEQNVRSYIEESERIDGQKTSPAAS